jgi:hypothetical protein
MVVTGGNKRRNKNKCGNSAEDLGELAMESGYPEIRVMASQGHSSATSFKHYHNNDWSPSEREEIKRETAG